jgi:hypothetical protein
MRPLTADDAFGVEYTSGIADADGTPVLGFLMLNRKLKRNAILRLYRYQTENGTIEIRATVVNEGGNQKREPA